MINKQEIMEEYIDFNKIASNTSYNVFKENKLNGLVNYFCRRNMTEDREDIVGDMIATTIFYINKLDPTLFIDNKIHYLNLLSRCVKNKLMKQYINKEDNKLVKTELNTDYVVEKEEESFIYTDNGLNLDILTEKERIFNSLELKILDEMLYENNIKTTKFNKKNINKIMNEYEINIHCVHNTAQKIIRTIYSKTDIYNAKQEIINNNDVKEAVMIIFGQSKAFEIDLDKALIFKNELIICLDYNLYSKDYFFKKYSNLNKKTILQTLYNIRCNIYKKTIMNSENIKELI